MHFKALHMVQHHCDAARRPARRLRQVILRGGQQCFSIHFTAYMAESPRLVSLEQEAYGRISSLCARPVHVVCVPSDYSNAYGACQTSQVQMHTSASVQALQSVTADRTPPFAPCEVCMKAIAGAELDTAEAIAYRRDPKASSAGAVSGQVDVVAAQHLHILDARQRRQ